MASKELTTPQILPSRRKFVWGLGILSAFAAIGSFSRLSFLGKKNPVPGKPGAKKTVKMLTQDGRLVEIDQSFLTANSKKVSNTELQNWIKK